MHLRSHVLLYFIDSLSQLFFYEMIFFNVITSKKLSKTKMDPEKMLERKKHILWSNLLRPPVRFQAAFHGVMNHLRPKAAGGDSMEKTGSTPKCFVWAPDIDPTRPEWQCFDSWSAWDPRQNPKNQDLGGFLTMISTVTNPHSDVRL